MENMNDLHNYESSMEDQLRAKKLVREIMRELSQFSVPELYEFSSSEIREFRDNFVNTMMSLEYARDDKSHSEVTPQAGILSVDTFCEIVLEHAKEYFEEVIYHAKANYHFDITVIKENRAKIIAYNQGIVTMLLRIHPYQKHKEVMQAIDRLLLMKVDAEIKVLNLVL